MEMLKFSVVIGKFIYSKALPLSLYASHVVTNWLKDPTLFIICKGTSSLRGTSENRNIVIFCGISIHSEALP